MAERKLILIGGGGHCKSCIDVIEQIGAFQIAGILDKPGLVGSSILNYPIVGTDDEIGNLIKSGYSFLITVGHIKSADIRKNIFNGLKNSGADIATIISPLAYVSKYANVGRGTIIMHGAKVNAGAKIGANVILNTGCNIEHDAVIGNNSHISTCAVVNGDAVIGHEVFIGSNATVSGQVSITNNCVIGAGTVVHKSIDFSGVYIGSTFSKMEPGSK